VIKKNLVIYYPSFERGGVEENIKNLINNFSKKIDVHLISSISKSHAKKIFKKKIKIYEVKNSRLLSFLPTRINSALSSMFLLFDLTSKLKKRNLIVHSMQSNIAAIIICLINNIKIVIRNSEDPIYSTYYSENFISSYIIFFLKVIFYNLCSCIITNSEGSNNSLKKFVFNKKKIRTIYNPYLKKINYQRYKKRNIIINVGRFRKQKNQILLIRAFYEFSQEYKNYKLFLIGDGILKQKLKNEIDFLKLNRKVFITGWKFKTTNYIKKSKLFVLTSLYEGLGNVLIDAINYNVPCISTNCKSGPNEILLNGRGGFIVKNNDVYELYKKMIFCIKNYDLALKKNKISKKSLHRFLMSRKVKEYENLLIKFENK
tara:strand:+ start:512 stop:1630 length:1119 start_codon:yes stop_codon:yes gene_type:complete